MLRLALLATTLLLAGCASARTSALVAGDSSDAYVELAPNTEVVPAPPGTSGNGDVAEPFRGLEMDAFPGDYTLDPAPLTSSAASPRAPAQEESLHSNRFTIKGGYYGSTEDAVDDGYIINASWTRFLNKLIAVELEIGYLDVDGSDAGVDTDIWSIPVLLNGRVNLPIWILEGYAGLGIGGFYYDAEAKGAVTADDSGFLWGGDAFLGASINLADSIALGLEAKYYLTDKIDEVDTGLDAFALMLTLGFSR